MKTCSMTERRMLESELVVVGVGMTVEDETKDVAPVRPSEVWKERLASLQLASGLRSAAW